MARLSKAYFFTGSTGTSGILFRTGNLPTQASYGKLFDSLLFPNDAADTATVTVAGHARLQTDALVKSRAVPIAGAHALAVQGHQIPETELIKGDDSTHTIIDDLVTPVQKGGLLGLLYVKTVGAISRNNFGLRVNVSKSIEIDATSQQLQLEGDETNTVLNAAPYAGDSVWMYDFLTNAKKWVLLSAIALAGNYFKRYEDTTSSNNSGTGTLESLSTFDLSTLTLGVGDTVKITYTGNIYGDATVGDTSYMAIGLGATPAGSVKYGQLFDSSTNHTIEIILEMKIKSATSFIYKVYPKRFLIPSEEYPLYGSITEFTFANVYGLAFTGAGGTVTNKLNFTVEQFKY